MCSKKFLESKSIHQPNAVARLAVFLGMGLGFSGELAGAAWLGWWLGKSWTNKGGPQQAPGLVAAAFVVLALGHVIGLLYRISSSQDKVEPGEDQ